MAERTGYANRYGTGQDDLDDLMEDIADLDWKNSSSRAVEEAKALIQELWEQPSRDDEPDIREAISEVPQEFRENILRTIMGDAGVVAGGAPAALLETEETRGLTEYRTDQLPEYWTEYQSEYRAEPISAAEEFAAKTDMEWEREQTNHTMRYLDEADCRELIQHLEQAMRDSRELESFRNLPGDLTTYGRNGTHEKYVHCIADLPATLEAKEAMEPSQWSQEERWNAALHEVNRMGYRTNLEILDRLMTSFSHGNQVAQEAGKHGMSDETVEQIAQAGRNKNLWVENRRLEENPTCDRIETAMKISVIETHLIRSIWRGDEAEVLRATEPPRSREELDQKAREAMADVDPETREAMRRALEAARNWSDEAVRDGAMDYHLRYAELRYENANGERIHWLEETQQAGERREMAGDCATRALNEAGGGGEYGRLWDEMTESTRRDSAERDADQGVEPRRYREVYEAEGMQMVLDGRENMDHMMRQHLDIREIPALLEELFQERGETLDYIGCSDGHAVAVVDGALRDSWDSRDMADRLKYNPDGGLVELWLKTQDDSLLEDVREILERYERVRRYDDALTYGRRRRHAMPND